MGQITDLVYKYDLTAITVLAIANVVVLIVTFFMLKRGNRVLYPTGNKRFERGADAIVKESDIEILLKYRNRVISAYSIYANFTAIFPLLGILGTVAALVKTSGTEMMSNLMVALNTTLLGVFFAIVFKLLDPILSGRAEAFTDDADYITREYSKRGLMDEA